jgi:hypothetical protein
MEKKWMAGNDQLPVGEVDWVTHKFTTKSEYVTTHDQFGQVVHVGDTVVFADEADECCRKLGCAHVVAIHKSKVDVDAYRKCGHYDGTQQKYVYDSLRPLQLLRFLRVPPETYEAFKTTEKYRRDYGVEEGWTGHYCHELN